MDIGEAAPGRLAEHFFGAMEKFVGFSERMRGERIVRNDVMDQYTQRIEVLTENITKNFEVFKSLSEQHERKVLFNLKGDVVSLLMRNVMM